ncbi:uncharacterized protein LOC120665575 [Panicum virgatum]|uniref:Uncharacterized protein n=1 Tax=Panicum virgatum TaxID=38727 RepID=A0A8T0U9J0_PANVG|nr:uncharacterized protein LOC120665575 [Panicum virgatum]KAG2619480.1 hypothetical protein PVAP13_3NG076000 [Panicum virgatum]
MEVEAMLEDDVFFAELSKRISLLITDDDEGADFAAAAQFIPAAAAPLTGFASLGHVPPRQQQGGGASLLAPPPYTLYHHHHHGASYGGDSAALAAAWQQQQQQQHGSKGTGVFIPRSTPGAAHPKKKSKNRGGAAAKAARAAQAGANALAAGGPAKKRA